MIFLFEILQSGGFSDPYRFYIRNSKTCTEFRGFFTMKLQIIYPQGFENFIHEMSVWIYQHTNLGYKWRNTSAYFISLIE